MKWKEYLELAGFLLVILGLYLVQREIVLNRTIARAELVQETAHNFFEIDQLLMTPPMNETWIKSANSPETLSTEEKLSLNLFLENILVQYDRECLFYFFDILDECEFYPRTTSLKYFGTAYGREYWETARNNRPNQIVAGVIDRVLAAEPSTDINAIMNLNIGTSIQN